VKISESLFLDPIKLSFVWRTLSTVWYDKTQLFSV